MYNVHMIYVLCVKVSCNAGQALEGSSFVSECVVPCCSPQKPIRCGQEMIGTSKWGSGGRVEVLQHQHTEVAVYGGY